MAKEGGYSYYVSDEQLEAYARLSLLERLRWVDEMRLFTLMASTPEITERRERLRRGELIILLTFPKNKTHQDLVLMMRRYK